jgi:cytochrome c biogenesis protein CcdA
MTRPLVAAGARLSQSIGQGGPQRDAAVLPSFLLGIATGLLWAPCAGPILGLVLTGAALEGASAGTSLLLLAYRPVPRPRWRWRCWREAASLPP